MNAAVSIVLLAAVLGVIVFLLSRRENTRRSQYGPARLSALRPFESRAKGGCPTGGRAISSA